MLPSMEILHFLVEKPAYNVRTKLAMAAKKMALEETTLQIKFILNDKLNSVTHVAELWKIKVCSRKEEEVQPELINHELLFLLSQVIKQLSSGQFLNEVIRNHEASRKFIIDFQI